MKKKIKIVLQVSGSLLVCVLAWTTYVASKGFFYFPPGSPLRDGEIGVVAIGNGTADVFSVYTPLGGRGIYPIPMTNTSANRFVLTDRGEVLAQFDIERHLAWIVWSNMGESSNKGFEHGHRHIALPCIWPPSFNTIQCVLAELAQPTVIKGATVTDFGIYTASVFRTVADTNSVRGIREDYCSIAFVRSATNISVGSGVMFGMRYRIDGGPEGRPLTIIRRCVHPPVRGFRSRELTTINETVQETHVGARDSYLRLLADDQLVVPGTWTFQLWNKGDKLCEQSFELVAVVNNGCTQPEKKMPEQSDAPRQ